MKTPQSKNFLNAARPFAFLTSSKLYKLLTIAAIIVSALTLVHFFFGKIIAHVFIELHEELDLLFATHPIAVLVIFQLLFTVNHLFILPVHSLTCVALAMILKNFLLALATAVLFSLVASVLVYFVVQELFYDRLWRVYKENELLNVLLEESKRRPFQVALMARMMAIPIGLKDYLLALVHVPLAQYAASAVLSNCVFVSTAVGIGVSLDSLDEVFEGRRSWAEKRWSEKLSLALFLAVALFTSLAVFVISFWTKRKLQVQRAQREVALTAIKAEC